LDITFNASVTSTILSALSVNTHIFCSIDYVTQTAMMLFQSSWRTWLSGVTNLWSSCKL